MRDMNDSEGRVYRIIRFRFNGRPRTLRTGLTLSEAQAHCNDPETSSSTASPATLRRVRGTWFDGYDYIKGFRPVESAR